MTKILKEYAIKQHFILFQMRLLYLIKDDNDKIRMVAQTKTFRIKVQIEECR